MPRPRKTAADKRSMRLPAASVTPAELASVEHQALAAGLSAPEFVRRCVLGRQIMPRQTQTDGAALVELIRVGNNLNQLARAANSGRMPAASELRGMLAELRNVMSKLLHQSDRRPLPEFGKIDAPANTHQSDGEASSACGQIDEHQRCQGNPGAFFRSGKSAKHFHGGGSDGP